MRLSLALTVAAALLLGVLASTASAHAGAAPTLKASTTAVAFGDGLTLRGVAPGATAGQEVQVLSQACGFAQPVPIGTTKTAAGGAFSFAVQPMLNSTLLVQVADSTSSGVRVTVRPSVQLRRVGSRVFGVDVAVGNGNFFTSKVSLERYDTAKKRWLTVGSGTLKANSDPGAITAISSATIRASVKPGTRVRASMSQASLGACFRPATSPELTA